MTAVVPKATNSPISLTAMAAAAVLFVVAPWASARADDMSGSLAQTHKEIEQVFGKVPEFIKAFPEAALPGAWNEAKALEFSDDTALSAKTKALIGLAVAAQIPCQYCIWSDTQSAKKAGASDQEIKEAVAVSALERHWSTVFNGMQVDLAQFKKDLGGDTAAKP
ncbi:carboxymuconolactone decarboxylase family protein [Labrys okinawensis]|uniref:carboxymuconolactone decarboxylase family protein n=1 Tax=Labrys okinawensis TaxID=346911 RepID=UPI0039BD0638